MTVATSSHCAKIVRLAADIAQLRLPPSDIADLRYFFNEFEADIGVRSLHFAQFDAMMGYRGTSEAWFEPQVEPRACAARQLAGRVSRNLRAMIAAGRSFDVTVLYRMYGPRPPGVRWETFRELAPIAEYTPTIEAHVERMTRALQMKITSRALEALGPLDRFALERVTTKVRDRVTPGEVLVTRLDRRPRRKEGMSNEAFAKVRQDAREAQADFVRTVLREADQILVAASKAYRDAKASRGAR
jgi:hypothetical protein